MTLSEIFADAIEGREPDPLHDELQAYLIDVPGLGPMIKHPLVFALFYMPQLNRLYNEQLRMKREGLDEARAERNWEKYIFLHERPFRRMAFENVQWNMRDRTYWRLLGLVWRDSENIREDPEAWEELLTSDRPHRDAMMTAEDRQALAMMGDEFAIWQGHTVDRDDGWSWTVDRSKALWFADRFADLETSAPALSTARVRRSDVLAYMTQRGENEIIVDPAKVIGRKEVAL